MSFTESIRKKLVSGGVWATLGNVVAAICIFIINILLTRLLTPQEVGAYYIITSIVVICALIAQFGAHQAIVKQLGFVGVTALNKQKKIIKTVFIVVLTGAFLVCLPFSLGVSGLVGEKLFSSSLVAGAGFFISFWILLRASQTTISQIYRGKQCFFRATVFEGALTSLLITSAFGICWIFNIPISFDEALIITLCALAISVATGMFLLVRGFWQIKAEKGYEFFSLLQLSFPLFVASIAIPGAAEAHVWILAANSNEEMVAIYGVAYRLAKFVVIPLLIINSVLPPIIANLYAKKESAMIETILRFTATLAAIPSVLGMLFLFFYSTEILSLLFGEVYSKGSSVLIMIVFAQTINVLTGSPGVLLSMSGHQKVVMNYALLSGVIGLLVSLLLVIDMGIVGVALGVSVGLISHNFFMCWYCWSLLKIKTYPSFGSLKKIRSTILSLK